MAVAIIGLLRWWVDPDCGGQRMGLRAAALEAVRRGEERVIEHSLAHAAQLLSQPVARAVRRHVANA